MTRTKKLLLAAAGLAAVVTLLVGWRYVAGPAMPAYAVVRADLQQTVVATGRVESPRRVEIGSPLTGTVAEVPVEEGQAVHAGQLLVRLDDTEARAAVDQSRHAVAQAEAKLAQLRATALPVAVQAERQAEVTIANADRALARNRELHARGFVGDAVLEDAQRARDLAASQLESARVQRRSEDAGGTDSRLAQTALDAANAALRVAQARLDNATLEAPVEGVLIARKVERGAVVQPGKVLMVLSPRGPTQLVVQVDEKNLPLVALGQEALVSADAYPQQRFAATVAYINPGIDATRGSIEVKLDVTSPPPYLLQDMTVSVDIQCARRSQVLTMPADALRPGDWVFAVRDGRLVRQPVKLGARGDGRVEVVEGLAEGERVLPANHGTAKEGARVRAAAAS